MAKTLLIVESDPSIVEDLRTHLGHRGFSLEHTADGKACVELTRRTRPDAVIIAVELPNGQNGYLVCREIKKDDDLKAIPVVIIGNPEKFADHKKLRTHADEYVAKPLKMAQLMEKLGPLVGGFPEEEIGEAAPEETLSLTELMDDSVEEPGEEISVESGDDFADPDLALLDGEGGLTGPGSSATTSANASIEALGGDDMGGAIESETPGELSADEASGHDDDALASMADSGADSGDESVVFDESELTHPSLKSNAPGADDSADSAAAEQTLAALDTDDALAALGGELGGEREAPPVSSDADDEMNIAFDEPTPAAPAPVTRAEASPPPPTPLRTGASADAAELRSLRARSAELQELLERAEARLAEMEAELNQKREEAEAARQGGSKTDKDYFALREAANKKDKEILRLKGELNQKEQSELEIREHEVQLEQKLAEQNAEMGRKDAQLKTLTSRADALLSEKKRAEAQTNTAREETHHLEAELSEARAALATTEESLQALRNESSGSQSQLNQLQRDLEETRAHMSEQATTFGEESGNLRTRVGELENEMKTHEARVAKLYQRIKDDEKLRDRVKKALSIATQLLDESAATPVEESEAGNDEPRAA